MGASSDTCRNELASLQCWQSWSCNIATTACLTLINYQSQAHYLIKLPVSLSSTVLIQMFNTTITEWKSISPIPLLNQFTILTHHAPHGTWNPLCIPFPAHSSWSYSATKNTVFIYLLPWNYLPFCPWVCVMYVCVYGMYLFSKVRYIRF